MVGPPQIISRSTWRSLVGHGGPPPGQWGTREGDVAGWPIVLGPHLSCAHPPPARRTPSWRPTALRHQLYIPDTVRVRTCKTGEVKHAEKVKKKAAEPAPACPQIFTDLFPGPPRSNSAASTASGSHMSSREITAEPRGDRRVQRCRCRRRARRPESEQCAHVGSDFWRRTPLDRAVSRICRSLCETQMGP